MKKIVFFLLYGYFFLFYGIALAQINNGDILSLQQCIDVALKRHPSINAASHLVKAIDAKIGQVRSGYYPHLNFQSSYQRISPTASSNLRPDPYNSYTNSLNLSQTIFDFGKTATQIEIQNLNKESSQADLRDVTASVILGVKQAYRAFAQAKMSRDVAKETLSQFQSHYEKAKGFFETGKSSKIDVTSAEVNVSNADINLIKAQNSLRLARVNLNNAMGFPDAPEYEISSELSYKPYDGTVEEALRHAYNNRPDLQSVAKKKEAQEKVIALNKKGYLPVLTGSATYGYTGNEFSIRSDDKYWNIGINLSFPFFTGFSTKYAISEAKSNLEVLKSSELTLTQKIFLEVESAFLSLRESNQRISVGKITVRQAEEKLALANGRYEAGVGSSLEITDAMVSLNNAKMNYITALSDYSVAQYNLGKAMGVIK